MVTFEQAQQLKVGQVIWCQLPDGFNGKKRYLSYKVTSTRVRERFGEIRIGIKAEGVPHRYAHCFAEGLERFHLEKPK